MAAYAALVSLMNTLDNIKNHPRLLSSLDKEQMESLGEMVSFLLDFVERYNADGGSRKAEDLVRQIASAAHAAEDVIESYLVDHILAGMSTTKSGRFLFELQKIMEDMDSIKKKIIKFKKKGELKDQQPTYSTPAASSGPVTTGKTTMVGFDGYLVQLLEELTGPQSDRRIMPVVGMGGIGKTTLARNVYENLLVVQHFDVRVWVTVSQEYNVREILFETLSCLGGSTNELHKKNEDELGEQLHKILFARRYLIILDDMWIVAAWEEIKFFFPENHNSSRIIITTRLSSVANHFGSLRLALNFLDDKDSWNLFCEKVFAEESCPPELEKVGKNIVKKSRGLPLSIVVIGGLLRKSPRTREYWENVAKDISSVLNSAEDNRCLGILSLSYNHLPARLKPCFLYLGIFPEDYVIRVSRIIKLWIAEGLIKPNKDKSLEEVAEEIVKDLVDRNLILVRSWGVNRKFKSCNIHDLVRNLCLRIAEKENFFGVTSARDASRDVYRQRRIVVHGNTKEIEHHSRVFHTWKSTLHSASLMCRSSLLSFRSRSLRVLIEVYGESLDTTFEQVNLRFVEYESGNFFVNYIKTYSLPSTISLLWNVQTLMITALKEVVAPSEIWEMPQLRHFRSNLIRLPDPPPSGEEDNVVMLNLQTLGTVLNFRCSEEVCKRMPNIKRLHISYDCSSGEDETCSGHYLYNVGRLNKLEALHCGFNKSPNRDDLLQNLTFMSSLEKLTLHDCKLHWDDLTVIGSFPRLEVLRLGMNSVVGPEWSPVEGEFLLLKFLRIDLAQDLIYWNADSSHFPVLETLILEYVTRLEEIPSSIGEIATLEHLYVYDCSISAAVSAVKILEEQESFGNRGLHVKVANAYDVRLEEFKEKLEQEGLTSLNFQLIDG